MSLAIRNMQIKTSRRKKKKKKKKKKLHGDLPPPPLCGCHQEKTKEQMLLKSLGKKTLKHCWKEYKFMQPLWISI
jgi:hypothetical protein